MAQIIHDARLATVWPAACTQGGDDMLALKTQTLSGRAQRVADVASEFPAATLEMLMARRLLRRTDTKFVATTDQLISVLSRIGPDYLLVPGADHCWSRYETVYFDTEDLTCFYQHRRGRRPRHKIRLRRYLDRDEVYFEIKTKAQNENTNKVRLRQPLGQRKLSAEAKQMIALHTALAPASLHPSVMMTFDRITLLGRATEERLTIDHNVQFDGSSALFEDVSIIEVKQSSLQRTTPIMRALSEHGVRSRPASKYCLALAIADSSLPRDHVRSAVRELERMKR
jgi:hypothetical protein